MTEDSFETMNVEKLQNMLIEQQSSDEKPKQKEIVKKSPKKEEKTRFYM